MKLSGSLAPSEGKKYAKAIARISEHIHFTLGAFPLLLNDEGRETYRYYRIVGVRPYEKGEYYLDGSYHIAVKAKKNAAAHWVSLILKRIEDD